MRVPAQEDFFISNSSEICILKKGEMDAGIAQFIDAVKKNNYDLAISSELSFYNSFVKAGESLSNWFYWLSETHQTKKMLDGRFKDMRNTLSLSISAQNSSFDVCIIFHNYSGLAHEQVMARVIRYLTSHIPDLKVLIVYIFGASSATSLARKTWLAPNVSFAFLEARTYTEAFETLGFLLRKQNPKNIIYPSLWFLAYWCSNFLDHSSQKFIVMKYPPPELGNLSAFAAGIHVPPYFELCEKWRRLPPAPHPSRKRRKVTDDNFVNIGSISRVEKQLSPEYSDFIFNALEENLSLRYLYTARESELGLLPQWLKTHPRTKFLGWVDPTDAIDFFDIYLETFPWGGGDMSYLAISRKIPYIALETFESKFLGVVSHVQHKFRLSGDSQSGVENNLEDLNKLINELTISPELRSQLGAKQFEVVFGGDGGERSFTEEWGSFLLS